MRKQWFKSLKDVWCTTNSALKWLENWRFGKYFLTIILIFDCGLYFLVAWSDLIKSAEAHCSPVDAAAQLADVHHVAVPGHAHLLHQPGAHPCVTRTKLSRGGYCAQFARVLKLELKKGKWVIVSFIFLSWYNAGTFCRVDIELLVEHRAGR